MDRIDLGNRKYTSVITGASSGIGAAVAIELAKRGSNISIFARSLAGLEVTAEKARALGVKVDLRAIDIADSEAVLAFARHIGSKYEGVHALVNNAGAEPHRQFSAGFPGRVQASARTSISGALSSQPRPSFP